LTLLIAITVGVLFATATYLLLSRELKATAMGVFLLGHGANLAILSVSRSPVGGTPPVLGEGGALSGTEVDPLPQALVLTAIVIGFAVQAFLLTLIVVTWRRMRTLETAELAGGPTPVEPAPFPHDARLGRFREVAADPSLGQADPVFDPDEIEDTPTARRNAFD
jgi:multicomponent Na+:H+ antiporter subunit C